MIKKKIVLFLAVLFSAVCVMMQSINISAASETGENIKREAVFTVSPSERLKDIYAYQSVLKDYYYAMLHETHDLENIVETADGISYFNLDDTGYAFIDMNSDGTDELILGTLYDEKSFMIAYTISNNKPHAVLIGYSRIQYSIGRNFDLYEFVFGGAPSQTTARNTLTIDGLGSDNPELNLELKEILFSDCVTNEGKMDCFWQYYDNPEDYYNRPEQYCYKDGNALISVEQANAKIAEWTDNYISIPYTPFSDLRDEFPQNLSPSQSRNTDIKQYQPILDILYNSIKNKDRPQIDGVNLFPCYDEHTLTDIGYTFLDLNHDGIDELITGSENPVSDFGIAQFYDVFTIANNEPVHVIRGQCGKSLAWIGKNGEIYYGYSNLMSDTLPYYERSIVNPRVSDYRDILKHVCGYGSFGYYHFEFEPEILFGDSTLDTYEEKYRDYKIPESKRNSIMVGWIIDKADFTFTHFSKYLMEKESANSRITGDVNADGKFNDADVVLFQKWLLAVPGIKLECRENADLCDDGKLNVSDLCMMKSMLIK